MSATLRDRLATRLRARSLDRALAAGAAPEDDAALALRAQMLVRACVREELAVALRSLLRDARTPNRAPIHTRAPLARAQVVEAEPELARLASRLQAVGPVEPRGVAQVRILLTDGTGPLYAGAPRQDLRAAVLGALAALVG